MPEDSNFEDESFDLSEIEDSVGTGPIFLFDGTRVEDTSAISVKKYDFTNPIILSDADLSKLKTKSEQFVYYLAGHLSMFLRTEFNLEMVSSPLASSFAKCIT